MAAQPILAEMAPPADPPRFVRLCPQHGTHTHSETRRAIKNLEGTTEFVICPKDHLVCRWAVWDRRMKRVIGYGSADSTTLVIGESGDAMLDDARQEKRSRVRRARKWDR